MISLYRDPQCKTVRLKIAPKDIPGTSNTNDAFKLEDYARNHTVEKMQKKIKELEKHVQSQQRQLELFADRNKSFYISSELNKTMSKTSKIKLNESPVITNGSREKQAAV